MKKPLVFGLIILIILVSGCVQGGLEQSLAEQACINSGGTVRIGLCCLSTGDFPNLCLVGPCGCSPRDAHEVKICDCGSDKCFDGNTCVSVGQ